MKMTTKNTLIPLAVVAVLLALAWWAVDSAGGMHVNIDGDEIDGPLGTFIGLIAAGGGLLLAAIICAGVAVFLGMLFAGLGILMIVGMTLLAVLVAAAVSPLLLPLLIPIGLYWFFVVRPRKQRAAAAAATNQLEHAV